MQRPPFRILHVEDDEVHARLVRKALTAGDPLVEVERAADGAEAIDHLRSAGARPPPDLVLLDLKLPKVDGYEVLAAIKQDEALRVIPVVVLTTTEREADLHRAYAGHANSYLVKPISFDQLKAMVAEVRHYWVQWNRSAPRPS